MKSSNLLREEKRELLNLVNYEYVKLDFTKLSSILDNNLAEPRWMDTYVWLYKAALPPDVTIYNILLEKLSTPVLLFYYKNGEDRFLANANEFMIKEYVNFLTNGAPVEYYVKSQYIPNKDYIKSILKIVKFSECGMYVKHIEKDKFKIENTDMCFENASEAKKMYEDLLDISDLYKNTNISKNILKINYKEALELGKDKKMLATISNICTFFKCDFDIKDGCLVLKNSDIKIQDEDTATKLQNKIIDAYHFFRNVINTQNKKDIISEIYNKKLDIGIKEQFEKDLVSYINIVKNKDLIDWIITISKESKYTLNITYDEQGIFYIDGAMIVTPLDAKEYYIDYMDKKKEKLAVAIYKNNIVTKIKQLWTRIKAKFAKT